MVGTISFFDRLGNWRCHLGVESMVNDHPGMDQGSLWLPSHFGLGDPEDIRFWNCSGIYLYIMGYNSLRGGTSMMDDWDVWTVYIPGTWTTDVGMKMYVMFRLWSRGMVKGRVIRSIVAHSLMTEVEL